MTNIITQPYRRPQKSEIDNYLVTLLNEFDLISTIAKSNSSADIDTKDFLKFHPTGKARIWALSTTGPGKRAWEKMQKNDLVVFYGNNEIYAYGEVASKVLWKNNNYIWPSGGNWDLIYSLKNFHEIVEGKRPIYQELRKVMNKLDVQSVGARNLEELGITKKDLLNFLLSKAERSEKTTKAKAQKAMARNISQTPPRIGEKFDNRTAIYKEYGGQWQQGITVFPNDLTLNVFSDEDGSYPDYQDPITGVIEYRGQGLAGDQKLTHGNKALEAARLSKSAIRFWFKPSGGKWSFEKWVIATDREPIIEIDSEGNSVNRILWYLVPIPSNSKSDWPDELVDLPIIRIDETTEKSSSKKANFEKRYAELLKTTSQPPSDTKQTSTPRFNYKRNRKLRQIVIERALNKCEYSSCTGMPPDVK
jgi:5-methylcytosine-specific restriction protein A